MGGRAGGRVPLCAPHMRGGSSILGPETPETPHWLCHRPTRLHTCSLAIPAGWESGWACTCTCTHIDATHATFISSRWSSHDFVHSSPVLNPGCDPMCLARQVRVADRDYKLSGSCAQLAVFCFSFCLRNRSTMLISQQSENNECVVGVGGAV